MKSILTLAATLAVALAFSKANAAFIVIDAGYSPNNVYGIYIQGDGTVFNGLSLSVTPRAGTLFQNVGSGQAAGGPRPPGFTGTYRNRALELDPNDLDNPGVGKGWTVLSPLTTSAEISFRGGPLGGNIDTSTEPGGRLFLANVLLSPGAYADYVISIVNGATTVGTFRGFIPGPEPSSDVLASTVLLGLAGMRRRKSTKSASRG